MAFDTDVRESGLQFLHEHFGCLEAEQQEESLAVKSEALREAGLLRSTDSLGVIESGVGCTGTVYGVCRRPYSCTVCAEPHTVQGAVCGECLR